MNWDPDTIQSFSRLLMATGFATALVLNVLRRNWGVVLGLGYGIFETYRNGRYLLHDWVRELLLGARPQDDAKHAIQSQLLTIAVAGFVGAAIMAVYLLRRAGAGQRLQCLGAALIFGLLVLELISVHRIDAIMYRPLGIFMVSAIGYFIGALIMAAGAALEPRPSTHPSRKIPRQPRKR